jgi:hypothetical protein
LPEQAKREENAQLAEHLAYVPYRLPYGKKSGFTLANIGLENHEDCCGEDCDTDSPEDGKATPCEDTPIISLVDFILAENVTSRGGIELEDRSEQLKQLL